MRKNNKKEGFYLKFIINKWANFFFFIDNLAFPIDTMHKEYNSQWLNEYELTTKEKTALEKYRQFKYLLFRQGGRKLFDDITAIFYQNTNSITKRKKELSSFLNKKQINDLEKIFFVFKKRFNKIWRKNLPILSNNLQNIQIHYQKKEKDFLLAFELIKNFYQNSSDKYSTEIFLIIRPFEGFVGGRVISKSPHSKILIESGKIGKKNKKIIWNHFWLLLLHELCHLFFETEIFQQKLNDFLKNKEELKQFLVTYPSTKTAYWATRRVMREMIINSVVLSSKIKRIFDKNYRFNKKLVLLRIKNWLEKTSSNPNDWGDIILKEGGVFKDYIIIKIDKYINKYLGIKELDNKLLNKLYEILYYFPKNLLEELSKK
ncbi:MAG: hypothetical protein N2692_00140 [Patescibacteria group bacterium]|jgi:hypothetical protein|nr:hypothetical protein [Patescibacteria group bacterium]